jgi:hypothetical protein
MSIKDQPSRTQGEYARVIHQLHAKQHEEEKSKNRRTDVGTTCSVPNKKNKI